MKFGLSENIIEKIQQVLTTNSKVDKAYIFGSRAKGNYREASDIDMAIKGQNLNYDDVLSLGVKLDEQNLPYKIDLLDYHTIKEPALKEHIDRVGIEFYSRWKKLKLGEVITFQRGHDLTRVDMSVGKYPVAGSNGIIGYHNKYTTKGPGVTIGRSGNIGTPHYYENDFWAHNTVLYIKDFKVSEPKFIYYFLKTIDFTQFNAGSSVPTLNRNHIHDLDFLLPPLSEQTAIASILSSLDDKIDLLHRQNKTLEQLAETLFRQWFVEEENNAVKLGTVIKTSSGGTPSRSKMEYYHNGTIKWVKSKELQGSYIFETEEKVTDEAVKNSSAKLFPANTILIAMYGATVGEYAILAEPATCNQAVCGLIPNDNYPYTFLFILTKYNKENLIGLAVGSAQQNISQELIKDIEIPNSVDKIKEFHKSVETYFDKIKSNQTQIRTLTQTRDTLLPKLMSGEVRVEI